MAFYSTSIEQLPELDNLSREHSDRVFACLIELIESNQGFIGFDEYMQTVLHAPGLGYYSAGSQKFGQQGDYVTAPLISPLFSQTLARYIAAHSLAGDRILELGGGTGKMAADILTELAAQDSDVDSYSILEPSADLRDRQQHTVATVAPVQAGQVAWLDRLSAQQGFRGIVVANEVLDAMPVKRFVLQSGEVYELGVGICEGQLCWKMHLAGDELQQAVLARLPLLPERYPDGYVSECQQATAAWLQALYEHMAEGLVILLDYGHERSAFYAPDRGAGTLRGYYRHFMLQDPFMYPGMIDLTASVDFTDVAESALAVGFQVAGYTSQANFLIDSGLLELAQAADETPVDDGLSARLSVAEAIKCLTDPGEMGESIKVMLLTKQRDIDTGIQRDQRYRL